MRSIIIYYYNLIYLFFWPDKCTICLDKINCTNKYKLECGHVFHTTCIMSWFRQKKDTCPYCRSKGNISIVHETNNPNNRNNIIEDWESNQHVIDFRGSSNPTKNQIIEAYYIRDINMNLSIDDCFESCTRGMSCNPDTFKNQIVCEFKRINEMKFKQFLHSSIELDNEHDNEFNITVNISQYISTNLQSNKFKDKLKMYNEMKIMKDNNNHKGIYSLIDVNNLLALGW